MLHLVRVRTWSATTRAAAAASAWRGLTHFMGAGAGVPSHQPSDRRYA
jgi:hypothetical protein